MCFGGKYQYTCSLLVLFEMGAPQGGHCVPLFRFFVLLRSLKLFPKSFLLSFGKGFFYCSLENISNMKILHNSDTVTTPFICGSWKAGNTAYFFHLPLLINFITPSTLFWESALMQNTVAYSYVRGKLFSFLKHFSLLKSWITLSKYPICVNKCLIKQNR